MYLHLMGNTWIPGPKPLLMGILLQIKLLITYHKVTKASPATLKYCMLRNGRVIGREPGIQSKAVLKWRLISLDALLEKITKCFDSKIRIRTHTHRHTPQKEETDFQNKTDKSPSMKILLLTGWMKRSQLLMQKILFKLYKSSSMLISLRILGWKAYFYKKIRNCQNWFNWYWINKQ